ncbi:hypothetical protein Raf01_97470 [Rugosimonospora africana]|uniref:Uncharacterized protein n=1 Tax=Rugosimonospora africana TaxID=556532 RepID=A0A8J3R5B3_9ACTN|nr:hypothetical protein Raf01_97470 [Rugosimonospora africana]
MRSVTLPIEAPSGRAYVVEAVPQGAISSQVFDNEVLQWTSSLPLLAELVGFLRHWLVYKGTWTVLVRPAASEGRDTVVYQESARSRKAAAEQMAEAGERIRRGQQRPSWP